MQKIRRLLRTLGGGEDGTVVVLKDIEQIRDIGGVIFIRPRRDAELGAKERPAQFGEDLLEKNWGRRI